MARKLLLSGFILVYIFLASGCTIGRGVQGMGEGFKEDWVTLKKADNWTKENLW